MAYFSGASTGVLNNVLPGGAGALYRTPRQGNSIAGGGAIWKYCSSHGATDIVATGFFTAVGMFASTSTNASTGTLHPNIVNRHANALGVLVGDIVLNQESSAGATPGRLTWHSVTSSTWGGSTSIFSSTAGYDCTVSAHAST